MRIVLDTNVLVSGLLTPGGNCAQILAHFKESQILLAYDMRMYSEYRRVLLQGRLPIKRESAETVLDSIVRLADCVMATPLPVKFVHQDDKVFFEVSQTVQGLLVTGNKRHYPENLWVLTPGDFMSLIQRLEMSDEEIEADIPNDKDYDPNEEAIVED
ncbi:MAG: putative toxin-antitoxin system toxin component, PIN family [Actinomycetes bacterium]|jgi:putative PIN family toxin of toxin-antitoxin system|nr:putative toxin-antitoxin system toxin component, PIN family [Actinomycetes bacterium]